MLIFSWIRIKIDLFSAWYICHSRQTGKINFVFTQILALGMFLQFSNIFTLFLLGSVFLYKRTWQLTFLFNRNLLNKVFSLSRFWKEVLGENSFCRNEERAHNDNSLEKSYLKSIIFFQLKETCSIIKQSYNEIKKSTFCLRSWVTFCQILPMKVNLGMNLLHWI